MESSFSPQLKEFAAIPYHADESMGQYWPHYPSAGEGAAMILVDQMYARLGVGKLALQRLLGVNSHNTLRNWEKGRHTPCQLFVSRMVMLLSLKDEGYIVSDIREIDWNEGQIFWRKPPPKIEPVLAAG